MRISILSMALKSYKEGAKSVVSQNEVLLHGYGVM